MWNIKIYKSKLIREHLPTIYVVQVFSLFVLILKIVLRYSKLFKF